MSKVVDEMISTWSRKDVQYTLYLMLPVVFATVLGLMYSVDPIEDAQWEGEFGKFGGNKTAHIEPGEVAVWVEKTNWKVTVVIEDPHGETVINRTTATVSESIIITENGQDRLYLKVGSFEVEAAGTYRIAANNTVDLYITKDITQGGFLSFMCVGGLIGIAIAFATYFFLFKTRRLPPK